jgi:photosystem II stability/assembly factor-like uncharacterized protein
MKIIILCLLATAAGAWWSVQNSGIDTNLRAVSVVPGKRTGQITTIWASGSNGVILRTTDSGKNWERLHVPDGGSLDFRGVQVFDENNAYIMSSGDGDQSRIYKTVDAGKNWDLQYADQRKRFFLDAIACASAANCFALSDPVQGKFLVLHTEDGNNWKEMPNAGMPAALAKEGVFAASNSSLLLYGEREIYFGTGGPAARVFHSTDLGKTWTVVETPIRSGTAPRGIFSLARSGNTIVAVGGDYTKPEQAEGVATYSLDERWHSWATKGRRREQRASWRVIGSKPSRKVWSRTETVQVPTAPCAGQWFGQK